ncbi:MAG: hypothetical protein HYX69_20770 [Planctomycetia bacterium]|nr:hypothetical protein [Planctomycetia bacterium]
MVQRKARRMQAGAQWRACILACAVLGGLGKVSASAPGLVGYWKLQGDCRDYSGQDHHGTNNNVDLTTSTFDGRSGHVTVPDAPQFHFGSGDFSISAQVSTDQEIDDAIGDILTKFDPEQRRGFNFTINASAGGYNSQSNVRHPFFGVDNASVGQWTDCGRPNAKTHISDALTVFEGDLYAGTTDALDEADWAHVYRFKGGQEWEDCGRVGKGRTRGVYSLVVHDDTLHAATSADHGPGEPKDKRFDYGRVYRYRGGRNWEDLGQPGEQYRMNCLASFRGKLYVCGFNSGQVPGFCYVYQGGRRWDVCGEFDGRPHTMAVHDGRLYAAYPKGEVYAYDGQTWENLGNPLGSFDECNQIHSLGVHNGELYIGSWPKGKVAVLRQGKWVDLGRLGDATEIVALTVYNGSFYAGSIPRAEVFRLDGDAKWTSIRRLFDPPGFEPAPVGRIVKAVQDWTRASSLTGYQGKLFVSTATCYRTMIDPPLPDEIRGKVYSFATGAAVSYDRDLGPGWKHLVASRVGRDLNLHIDGQLVASSKTDGNPIDVSNESPLQIGFGPQSHFHGKIREVRLYNRALDKDEIQSFYREVGNCRVSTK